MSLFVLETRKTISIRDLRISTRCVINLDCGYLAISTLMTSSCDNRILNRFIDKRYDKFHMYSYVLSVNTILPIVSRSNVFCQSKQKLYWQLKSYSIRQIVIGRNNSGQLTANPILFTRGLFQFFFLYRLIDIGANQMRRSTSRPIISQITRSLIISLINCTALP